MNKTSDLCTVYSLVFVLRLNINRLLKFLETIVKMESCVLFLDGPVQHVIIFSRTSCSRCCPLWSMKRIVQVDIILVRKW